MRCLVRAGDVLRLPAHLAEQVCNVPLRSHLQRALPGPCCDDGSGDDDILQPDGYVAGMRMSDEMPARDFYLRIVHKSPGALRVMKTRAAANVGKLEKQSMVVTLHSVHAAHHSHSDDGEAGACILFQPDGPAMVLEDLRQVFDELQDEDIHSWAPTRSLVFSLPDFPCDDVCSRVVVSQCLSELLHCKGGMVVAPTEVAMRRTLHTLHDFGYVSFEDKHGQREWSLKDVARKGMEMGIPIHRGHALCRPRPDVAIDMMTHFEASALLGTMVGPGETCLAGSNASSTSN